MALPRAYLSQKLTQPLPIKDGAVLRTIGDAANDVLALPQEQAEHCNRGATLPSSSLTRPTLPR